VTSIAVLIGRIVAGCLGAILIYSALFLYKEEEGGLENRIEQWWQRIRDLHAHAISRETAFLKVVADVTSKGFAKLFGKRLFGAKAVAASMCYSQAAIFFLVTITGLPNLPPRQMEGTRLTTGILCLVFLFIGSLGPFIDRQSQKLFWLSSVLIATVGWPPLFMAVFNRIVSKSYSWTEISIPIAEMILFAVACDFLFIALTRVMLARAAKSSSFLTIATLAIGNAFLAAALSIGPIVASMWLDSLLKLRAIYDAHGHLIMGPHILATQFIRNLVTLVDIPLLLVGASNFLDALVSLSWFLIAIMMLLHRLFWPLIERPVYALFRHRVFSEQKKLVFFSGVALVGLAIPRVGQALENVVKAVHG
jgi:hypothetical protein